MTASDAATHEAHARPAALAGAGGLGRADGTLPADLDAAAIIDRAPPA